MKKKLLKIIIFSLLFSSLAIPNSKKIEAAVAPPLLNGNLTWNITRVYYFLDATAAAFATPVASAANNWVYTGFGWNNLYPNIRTYNIISSAIDVYGYRANDNANGFTAFFNRVNGNGSVYQVNPNNQNWLFSNVSLNGYYLSGKSNATIQGVVAHEMGHVFGLNENNANKYSIMCQTAYGRAVYTVQAVDNQSFNRKHP